MMSDEADTHESPVSESASAANHGGQRALETTRAALPPPAAAPPRPAPLLPERSDFLEGADAPAAEKVGAFLAKALEATGSEATEALVPWICDVLLSNHSVKAYGRDLLDFVRHMRAQGVDPLQVTADHVKCYKRALLEAGMKSATVARRLSVLRGTYHQLAAKGLIAWETAQDIAAVKAPGVQKNSTPSLTERQAISLLEAIPTETLQGIRDLALMSVFFITGCRVSAVVGASVGHLETDGVEHYLHVTEKRNKKRRKILLDAARPVLAYIARAGIGEDKEGPLFRPMKPDGTGLERRHLDRKTPWRLVKKYCRAAGIDPERLGGRGIGIHSLRKTAINDAIRNGASLHEVREFAGHADIRSTELYFVRQEEDAEVAARRIHIRVTGRKTD
jgi:integrase/recombinase XerD